MKITRLPDAVNPNVIIRKKIDEIYGSECPFCKKPLNQLLNHTISFWYGKQEGLPFLKRMTSRKRHWQQNHYYCTSCGAGWDSIAFPQDILSQEEVDEIYEKILLLEGLND